jgi:hypothetical protein
MSVWVMMASLKRSQTLQKRTTSQKFFASGYATFRRGKRIDKGSSDAS